MKDTDVESNCAFSVFSGSRGGKGSGISSQEVGVPSQEVRWSGQVCFLFPGSERGAVACPWPPPLSSP